MIKGVIKTSDILKNFLTILTYWPLAKILKLIVYMVDSKQHTFIDIEKFDKNDKV